MSTWDASFPYAAPEPLVGSLDAFPLVGKRPLAEDLDSEAGSKVGSHQKYSAPPRTSNVEQVNGSIDVLSSLYTIPVRSDIAAFLVRRRPLRTLLFDAYPKLVNIFGSGTKFELRVIEDMEEDSARLRVSINSRRDNARQALEQFDEEWWLDHVQHSEGLLNFVLRRE
jgi:hypothetical protein